MRPFNNGRGPLTNDLQVTTCALSTAAASVMANSPFCARCPSRALWPNDDTGPALTRTLDERGESREVLLIDNDTNTLWRVIPELVELFGDTADGRGGDDVGLYMRVRAHKTTIVSPMRRLVTSNAGKRQLTI